MSSYQIVTDHIIDSSIWTYFRQVLDFFESSVVLQEMTRCMPLGVQLYAARRSVGVPPECPEL